MKVKSFCNKVASVNEIIGYEILLLQIIFLLGYVQPAHYGHTENVLIGARICIARHSEMNRSPSVKERVQKNLLCYGDEQAYEI